MTIDVGEIATKVKERRLKWYGHVMRRGALRRKEGDGNESTEEEEDLREDGWIK